ncbi:hypothetical protein O6H91_06G039200 [Diphasiastrum complanatum]|uniref:Uncharacterized protein n=1 Tax=Diphasiastrum complanatum TaxID=34168 RepID=A0ACC2DCN8_DIPCM|nr:hypothetical protein O6H91_06G039200 [Diphasiastrum complanatum]
MEVFCNISMLFHIVLIFLVISSAASQDASSPQPDSTAAPTSDMPSINYYKAHGFLLWIAFGVLFPMGILLSRYGQGRLPHSHHVHASIQMLAVACGTAGIVIALKNFNALDSLHAKLGLALGCLIWTQSILGVIRPIRGACWRPQWYFLHWLFGTTAVVLGWYNIFQGLNLFVSDWPDDGSQRALYIIFSVQVALIAFAYLLLERWHHLKLQAIKDLNNTQLTTLAKDHRGETNA